MSFPTVSDPRVLAFIGKVGRCLKIIITNMYVAPGQYFWVNFLRNYFFFVFSKQFLYYFKQFSSDKSDDFLRGEEEINALEH